MSEILTPPPRGRPAGRSPRFRCLAHLLRPGLTMNYRHAIEAAGTDEAVPSRHHEVRNAAWVVIVASILIIALLVI